MHRGRDGGERRRGLRRHLDHQHGLGLGLVDAPPGDEPEHGGAHREQIDRASTSAP